MKTIARFAIEKRWLVIAAWIALVLVSLGVMRGFGATYKDEFKLPHTETQAVSDLLSKSGQSSQNNLDGIMVVHTLDKTPVTTAPAGVEQALTELCSPSYKVSDVSSPWGTVNCASQGGFVAGTSPSMVSTKDPSIGLVQIAFKGGGQFDQNAINNTYDHLKKLNSKTLEVEFTSDAFEGAGQSQSSSLPEMLGFLAALIILSIVFRTFGTVAIPLLSAVAALTTGLLLIDLLSHAMSVSNVTPELAQLMVIGVGIDYALFIVTRHRRNLLRGMSVEESIQVAINTSGRAVLFAGTTVCIAMLGLIALGVNFFYGMAIGVAVAVSLTMLTSLTLLPAVLSLLGRRALPRWKREPLPSDRRVSILLRVIPPVCVVFWVLYGIRGLYRLVMRPHSSQQATEQVPLWTRWAEQLANRKALYGTVAAAIIVLLAIPFFSMRLGHADQGNDPSNTTTRKGYDLIEQGFGVGYNSQLLLVVSGPNAGGLAGNVATAVKDVPDVDPTSVVAPPNPLTPTLDIVSIKSTTSPEDVKTTDLVNNLRDNVLPPIYGDTGGHVYVYGQTAVYVDFAHVLSSKMPLFIGAVVLLSFLLLMIAFRSVVIPLTAALMNLFAAGASFGVIVAVFQWGWGAETLGIGKGGPIEAFAPVLFFAILFGLSMDYQVFLVSRMHEEWVHTRDNRRAISVGQAETGGIITAAALIMICVFGGFLLGDNRVVKLIGLGLASAIFIDAFILRTVLVPALMHLFGKANWYFPKWLDRITPRVSVEPADEDDGWTPDPGTAPEREPVPV